MRLFGPSSPTGASFPRAGQTPPFFPAFSILAGIAAGLVCLLAVHHYEQRGLTLSHYDAKAHLVVARRILDSLTPGWRQIGAVWLPLPHLLNMLPVQNDAMYRTGAFAIALSVVCGAVTAAAFAATVLQLTRSRAGALAAATLALANPSVLYLHSTPMTEPLLFALCALMILAAVRWALAPDLHVPRLFGWLIVLACLTRYEAWPVSGAAIVLSAWAWWRRGTPLNALAPVVGRLLLYPLGAVAGFMLLSRLTVGAWFVGSGFFAPDPELQGHALTVIERMREGTIALAGSVVVTAGLVSAATIAATAIVWRARSALVIPLALAAAGALPFAAYLSGHPFRIRYEIPLVIAASLAIGIAAGLIRRIGPGVALLLLALVFRHTSPFDPQAPMVIEAQRDLGNRDGRRAVTECLAKSYRGETIMVSMGALAHYMQELSLAGFSIADFVHEGNHPLWDSAITRGPAPLVGWVLVEEYAEGGDALFRRARELPHFFDGFDRVCEGGHVALYKRRDRAAEVTDGP